MPARLDVALPFGSLFTEAILDHVEREYTQPTAAGGLCRVATFPLLSCYGCPSVWPKASILRNSDQRSYSELELNGLSQLASFVEQNDYLATRLSCLLLAHAEKLKEANHAISSESPSSPASASSSRKPSSCNAKLVKTGATKKSHKRVSFADERGIELYHIRMIDEPSDIPPQLNYEHLGKIYGIVEYFNDNNKLEEQQEKSNETDLVDGGSGSKMFVPDWQMTFEQPTVNFHDLYQRLEQQGVVLETVHIQDQSPDGQKPSILNGTIKVLNLAYEKNVFLRISDNAWRSFIDIPAQFACCDRAQGVDTFSVTAPLPKSSKSGAKSEFCIGYRIPSDSREFWDNNKGNNYVLSCGNVDVASKTKTVSKIPRFRDRMSGLNAMIQQRSYY